jgi:hypothetical protein
MNQTRKIKVVIKSDDLNITVLISPEVWRDVFESALPPKRTSSQQQA